MLEGEKSAEAARRLGLAATTSAQGANNAKRTDWSPLIGKMVIILPDNDKAGRNHAQAIVEILLKQDPNAIVKIANLPNAEKGYDIVKFIERELDSGKKHKEIKALIERLSSEAKKEQVAVSGYLIPEYKHFPLHCLPDPIREFVIAASDALGCDPAFFYLFSVH